MVYNFEAKISGYYHAEIEANSLEEAKEKGLKLYYETEFSNMEDIETEHLCITDDKENDYYY